MTGFARRVGAASDWSWAVEARSVNGRNLDVRFRGPPSFENLERAAREAVHKRCHRGQVTISMQARSTGKLTVGKIDFDAVEAYLRAGEPLVASGRLTAPSLDGMLALPGVVESVAGDELLGEHALIEAAMAASIEEALDGLMAARRDEGAALLGPLGALLDKVEALVEAATLEAAGHPAIIRDRFARRLTELAGEAATSERILLEAAAIASKADVREELDRLVGHLAAARGLLRQDGASGRRLDFLTQEFMREANTLCAKSATAALTAIGLDLKATIDQFREQVQNVE